MSTKRNALLERATILAEKPYSIEVIKDKTTTGKSIYLLVHHELDGCMAQGQTIEEGMSNLRDATREYILSLLEDGLPIPEPEITSSVTQYSDASTNHEDIYEVSPHSFFETLRGVVQPRGREFLGEITLVAQ